MSTFITGPIAPENNPPIEPLWFLPSNFTITAITRGVTTTVTTTSSVSAPSSNNFSIGQLVRFNIPKTYGIQEINGKVGYVLSKPASNQVTVGINSTTYSPFNAAPAYGPTPPQIAAIADINSGAINAAVASQQTFIAGSFINVSPVNQT
jgi:hypothetical protein